MNAQTKVSAKGQVVIPKDVRERYRLEAGRILDVIETPDGVLLRPRHDGLRISMEEAKRRLAKIIRYEGPPVSVDDMNETIREAWANPSSAW